VSLNPTHYDTLGVTPGATPADVRTAYRRLAVRYHPDKHGGNPHFEEQFKQVAEAYRVLQDPIRRAHYDAALLAARQRQAALLRQQRQAGAITWPVGHRYHYATTRPPASVRERGYHTVQQRAQLNRRDRRILLFLLMLLTTVVGGLAMWHNARSNDQADDAYLSGVLALKRGDWSKAIVEWGTAIREQPDFGAAYARRAEAIMEHQHDYNAALADFNVALHHLHAPADRVRSLAGRAACLTSLQRFPAAEAAYNDALNLDPAAASVRLARAELRLFEQRNFAGAIVDFSKLLRSATATPTECARAVKGRALAYYRLSDYPRATHDLLAVLSTDDTDGQVYYLLGRIAAEEGQPQRATACFAAATQRGYQPPLAMRQ
jgi:curved DNA-binding protein CbpA